MKAIFRGCGYTDMAREWGFSLYTECRSREVTLPRARRCRQLSVAEPFLERDYLIDLCKLKTHGMVGFSGAVKNLFGAVPGLQKPELHCRFQRSRLFQRCWWTCATFLRRTCASWTAFWPWRATAPPAGSHGRWGAGGQQKPLCFGCVRDLPDWLKAGERPYAAGGP